MCNVSVKYLRDHLKNAHKITEQEYEELFVDDSSAKSKRRRSVEDDTSSLSSSDQGTSMGYLNL